MRLALKTLSKLIRIVLIAGSVTLTGWTAFAAPEPWERRALDLPNGRLDWSDRQGLREMRVLRLAMNVAPGLMVDLIARGAPDVPRDVIARALEDAAHGRPMIDAEAVPAEPVPADRPQPRMIGGAKFLRSE